ncbi:hypothetical protein ACIBB8_35700, partial [Streptomyces sp. NPDC051286]
APSAGRSGSCRRSAASHLIPAPPPPDDRIRPPGRDDHPQIHRRYERKADHFLAFTSIARTLICYRRLTK